MKAHNAIRLTATELGSLWTMYINDTLAACVLDYFLSKAEDREIKAVVKKTYQSTSKHIQELTELFHSEEFPVPHGFAAEDVNPQAERLYSDSFFLYYIKNMTKVGIATYGLAYTTASRSDIRDLYRKALNQTEELDQEVTEVLQGKGLYVRPPCIGKPEKPDFVESKQFLSGGFFGFGEKRPLISIEIGYLFSNLQTNALGKTLLLGMKQVAKSEEIKKYLNRGIEISRKHIKLFSDILIGEDLPVPMSWDSDVLNSREAPFSDKLILYHVSLLVAAGSGNYGLAAAASPRKDIALEYIKLAAEIGKYAEEGAKLMIRLGWLEEPPMAPDREELAKL